MKEKGYTLTELMVVLAILAILVIIAIPVTSSVIDTAKVNKDKTMALSLETAIENWMNTDYSDDDFLSENLYYQNAPVGKIGVYSEKEYSYYFAGTKQLPGIELENENEIRHAVITAIKSSAETQTKTISGEQYLIPDSNKYGYKYYYKIGRVSVEPHNSEKNALGDEGNYKYYVWLDMPGGCISEDTTEKKFKDSAGLQVTPENMYAFHFDFGSRDKSRIYVEIESEDQVYTAFAQTETPAIFMPGKYNLSFYYNGELFFEVRNYMLNSQSDEITIG